MNRLLTTVAALALATGAHALVLEESMTPADSEETIVEENQEFVGDPVVDSNGVEIGTVTRVGLDTNGDRKIMVTFHDHAVEGVAGWVFDLDERWESGGSIDLTWTAEEIRGYLLNYAPAAD